MTSARPSIELFVRSLAPSATMQRQETVLDRLEALADRGVIEGYRVRVWGDRVAPDSRAAETDAGRSIVETVEAFEEWAQSEGCSVDRFYSQHAVSAGESVGRYDAVSLPVMAMAEYADGDLRCVTPHVRGDVVRTVPDRLDAIETRPSAPESGMTDRRSRAGDD